ncbi:UDP-N-acetylmuramoyl-tripeptide--D-alanyl-D-alanine ligase [Patescibacteria group bacterium]|nr:UDP-N-acetylmuramoyl-tripeptide--D-alanyl-D-alanine ligase [Patescibacteria group bacterium]
MRTLFKQIVVSILTAEAKFLLSRKKPYIIAVTGSVGKTSMKDAIFAMVKNRTSARKSEKSFNSEIGIPLTVLGLPNAWNSPIGWLKNIVDGAFIALCARQYPELLVIEAGVDRPGDMKQLVSWLRPDIAVITRLPDVPVHVEYFSSPEAVSAEKLLLAEGLKPEGALIFNHDDVRLQEYVKGIRRQAVGYGRDMPTHVTASADSTYYHDNAPAGFACTISHLGEAHPVRLPGVLGGHYAYTVAGAIAVALHRGMTLPEAVAATAEIAPPPGRMRIISGIKGTTLIDDTYNSSPTAATAALEAMREVKYAKRKIVVLGDMLELGKYSAREHERIGELVPDCADMLVTVGIRSQRTAEAALAHGMSEKYVLQYEEAVKAGKELQGLIQPGDVILVKGSQGIRAERIIEELMAEPDRAGELLVRQDDAWQER